MKTSENSDDHASQDSDCADMRASDVNGFVYLKTNFKPELRESRSYITDNSVDNLIATVQKGDD